MPAPTSIGRFAFIFALLFALLACSQERDESVVDGEPVAPLSGLAPPAEESFERSWQGVLPCSDCDGIRTRLTLRRGDDGRQEFELEETYLGAGDGNEFMLSGPWRQVLQRTHTGPATVFRIDPDGADQRFELKTDGSLELLDTRGRPRPDAINFRLQRI